MLLRRQRSAYFTTGLTLIEIADGVTVDEVRGESIYEKH